MSVQSRTDQKNFAIVISGEPKVKDNETLLQDAGRGTTALKAGTVMAKVAATGKWKPFINEAATDGSAIASGILLGDDVTGASLVAGDVTGAVILVGGPCTVDAQLLTIENSKSLATVRAGTTVYATTVEDDLMTKGIFVEGTIDIDVLEN